MQIVFFFLTVRSHKKRFKFDKIIRSDLDRTILQCEIVLLLYYFIYCVLSNTFIEQIVEFPYNPKAELNPWPRAEAVARSYLGGRPAC